MKHAAGRMQQNVPAVLRALEQNQGWGGQVLGFAAMAAKCRNQACGRFSVVFRLDHLFFPTAHR